MSLWVDDIFVIQSFDKYIKHWYLNINGKLVVQIPFKMTESQIFAFVKDLERENFY